jgi:hypothetical protein
MINIDNIEQTRDNLKRKSQDDKNTCDSYWIIQQGIKNCRTKITYC